ncbi:Hydroxymethylpyrimidine/phosphomethylpyrimidine kinase [Candidatus Hydrogenisulfobacillus filiaventi]|uniref:Hydroxymethylpyrimidine/phosphomethylpyrimidine kinase n=1 Tax=Candidatus Hydrogenisulfobacillus filiaventi TaxID=2707344 RepID=A0A6F8ZF02_9FIRM|nr:bifunctional hydroxymethylpyrimidine kinase/phosphomethylpyrimidine kinase [Bacillota bacterium]CAB1128325.1 Hydroxymethylpyrimidine/phosphomethylpyrimidine kinase [Candidatus Hydrogenisulfobacillus filiaventi]
MSPPPVVLTVAGSDSGAGAGLEADLKTFMALGVYGVTAVTAVTAQDTRGVYRVGAVDPVLIREQIRAVAGDFPVAAVKIGMVWSRAAVEAVVQALTATGLAGRCPIVIDPVLRASSGDPLLEPEAEAAYIAGLVPLATVLTPNLDEAAALTGRTVAARADMEVAAQALGARGIPWVVVKGGHLPAPEPAADLVWHQGTGRWLEGRRIPTTAGHGTGCTFASALAAYLARGEDPAAAAAGAKAFVAGALAHAPGLGHGRGPLAHDWRWRP